MSETKHTCGECFHFDACRKMMESALDPTWKDAFILVDKSPACQDFIEASLVMPAFRAAERLRGCKAANMEKTGKQPTVDRGKLLIGLECCRDNDKCPVCPYHGYGQYCGGDEIGSDALAYIGWLEEQLEEAGKR